jgi:pyruvate/2-oxoglutarate dehydrogenase complex dihydrolipoamide dehydrogenase (E3) component
MQSITQIHWCAMMADIIIVLSSVAANARRICSGENSMGPGLTDGGRGRSHSFDAIIVGSGQAGFPLAGRLTAAGMSVALVERGLFGGTCVNTGCTPTKTMVASAYVARLASRAIEFGIDIPTAPRVDLKAVKARADVIVHTHRGNVERLLSTMERCTVFRGHARFESSHEMRVGSDLISADRIFLDVGSRAIKPDMPGLEEIEYMTNSGIVALETIPRHLVIVGGSYIGLEFAQMYRRFGADVTIIERERHLLGREDEAISAEIRAILEREGIAVRLNAECLRFAAHPDGAAVIVDCVAGDREIVGTHVLVAVGRRPNTDDLGLENTSIDLDQRGYVVVDDQLRTTVDGVWALGDCNGRGAFTHTAYNDFEIVAANLLNGETRSVADRIPAYALYIDPPLGRVGMTETQARAAGRRVRVGGRPMSRVARAVEKGEAQGLMSVVVDAETDKILGAAILGPGGDEAIHGILDTMMAGALYTDLARTMPIHPTVSELIPTILSELVSDA